MPKFVNSNIVPSISLSTQCQKIAYSTMGPFMPLHYLPELIYVRLGRECLSGKSGLLSIQLLKPRPFTTQYVYSEKIDAFCKLISKPPLAHLPFQNWLLTQAHYPNIILIVILQEKPNAQSQPSHFLYQTILQNIYN